MKLESFDPPTGFGAAALEVHVGIELERREFYLCGDPGRLCPAPSYQDVVRNFSRRRTVSSRVLSFLQNTKRTFFWPILGSA